MKSKYSIIILLLFFVFPALSFAVPPADDPGMTLTQDATSGCPDGRPCSDSSGNSNFPGSVTMESASVGDPISETGVEKPWAEMRDLNGDVVASITVECSVLADGAQVCQIHFYVMSDTPGTLTNELTIDVDSD